jgi:hypothetical protein
MQPRALEQPENAAEHVRYDKQHVQNTTISPAALNEPCITIKLAATAQIYIYV